MDPELKNSIEELIATNKRLSQRWSLGRSILHGFLYGIGATIGAVLAIAIGAWILHSLAGVDLLKPIVDRLLPYVDQRQPGQLVPPVYEYETEASPAPTLEPSPDIESSPLSSPR